MTRRPSGAKATGGVWSSETREHRDGMLSDLREESDRRPDGDQKKTQRSNAERKKRHQSDLYEDRGGCKFGGEFDPGSGSTLAACLMHASRTEPSSDGHVADG